MTAQPQVYHLILDLWNRVSVDMPGLQTMPVCSSWQRWLSPRPTQRSKTVQYASVIAHEGAIVYEFPVHKGHRAVRETHYLRDRSVREGKSGPPL